MQSQNHELCSTGIVDDQTRKVGWVGYAAHMEEVRNSYNIFIKKPE
jgi:hypothetical protein